MTARIKRAVRDNQTTDMFGFEGMHFDMPKIGTLAYRLAIRLLQGETVTAPSFYKQTGSMRGPAFALELRRDCGWPMEPMPRIGIEGEAPNKRFAQVKVTQSALQPLREQFRSTFGQALGDCS